jgi:aminoglycoside phosphotransferase (APT) family kinase protein
MVFPDTLFEEQYALMQLMHDSGSVRVAKPMWLESDASLLGAPFFVMEKMIGRVPVSVPPYRVSGWVAEATPKQRRQMWENGVRQLAAIQTVSPSEAQFLAGPDHARDGLAQEFDKYARFVDWLKDLPAGPVVAMGLARLKELWPDNQPPGIVWGDARLGNMMFDDDFEVIAVMDWEQPSLGGALNDLAWWTVISETMHGATSDRPHLEGMGTRTETIALWSALTGISAQDVEWFEEFTHLKMSCLSARMADLRGQPSPDLSGMAKRLKVD